MVGHPTHGMRQSAEYIAWRNMKARCNNPKNNTCQYYGGRGIQVAPVFSKFEGFFKEVGRRPSSEHSLDRIDNDGNYEPGNVHWVRKRDQMINRSDNRYLTHAGKTQTLLEWSEEVNIPLATLWRRLDVGWTIEQTLTEPIWDPSKAGRKGAMGRWGTR